MKMNEYFDALDLIIENMSESEFDNLLLSSGIEHCPYEETFKFDLKFSSAPANKYIAPRVYYNDFADSIKVA